MKLLGSVKSFKVMLYCNAFLLVAHIAIESRSHDVNWLRLGERSPLAMVCMDVEGLFAVFTGLAIFEMYYPSMTNLARSKELKQFGVLLVIQILVWCFYK